MVNYINESGYADETIENQQGITCKKLREAMKIKLMEEELKKLE